MKKLVMVGSLVAVFLAVIILIAISPAAAGLRKTIAVSEFDNKSVWSGEWKIGRIELTSVKEKYSIAKIVSSSDMQRGEILQSD